VWVKGQELEPALSSAQFTLLQTLSGSPGRVFTRDELTPLVWADEDPSGISDEALNSLVRRLRRRLRSVDPSHRYVYAVRGHGFKFEQPPRSEET
jgi:DNA-binding response OmpR family regulator